VVVAIIAILAAMLLPALAAAREKARRSVCGGNLKQIATALVGYLSDYNSYYPAFCGYGDLTFTEAMANSYEKHKVGPGGIYTDARTGQSIMTHIGGSRGNEVFDGRDSFWRYRTFGAGYHRDGSYRSPGELRMGPIGLGYLVLAGYLPDVRSFYCPSSDGMNSDFGGPNMRANRIADWELAGGFDGRTLTHGNWDHISMSYYRDANQVKTAIYGHYNYQNFPIATAVGTGLGPRMPVCWTRPYQWATECWVPPFKTEKLLGARGLVSDTFSSYTGGSSRGGYFRYVQGNYVLEALSSENEWAGWGMWGHKDGYNVLYGDFHTAWYGDPQQTLIWWKQMWEARLTLTSYALTHPFNTALVADYNAYWNAGRRANQHIGGRIVWHILDMANKVDVGAKMCETYPHSMWKYGE